MCQNFLIIFTFIWPACYAIIAPNHNGTEKFLLTGAYVPRVQTHAKHTVSLANLDYFHLNDPTEFGDGHFCGGTIIGDQVILTAAHCVYNLRETPEKIVVIAGTPIRIKRVKSTQILHVRQIIIHSRYRYLGDSPHDIALLLLVETIKEDEHTAKKAPMSRTNQAVTGARCEALGWGATKADQLVFSEPVQHAHLIVFRDEACPRAKIENTFCAGDPMKRARGACRGDAGGPLFCRGFISGIIIFNQNCTLVEPTYFTDVSRYLDWIQSQFLGLYDFRYSGQGEIVNNIFVKIASVIVCLFVKNYIK